MRKWWDWGYMRNFITRWMSSFKRNIRWQWLTAGFIFFSLEPFPLVTLGEKVLPNCKGFTGNDKKDDGSEFTVNSDFEKGMLKESGNFKDEWLRSEQGFDNWEWSFSVSFFCFLLSLWGFVCLFFFFFFFLFVFFFFFFFVVVVGGCGCCCFCCCCLLLLLFF